ncbi:MAG: thiamine pyrophosphate-dependent enzyme [Bacillota bacterium]|nr:thiamine pyrophosphate-dependent enzyme [Bacillota bacterium]
MTTKNEPGKTYLMQGNEAIVRGALEGGIHFASSYPGSPSSQVLGMLGHIAEGMGFRAEWSTNETTALQSCMGASFANARSICIVKQNGLLVQSDAIHCGALGGIKGGLVIISSDDPDSHSSTNEFDSRHMAVSANIPMLEPASVQETKDMIPYALQLSEELEQMVLIRVTTRICHGRGGVELGELPEKRPFTPIGEWDRMVGINWLHGFLLEKLERARAEFEGSDFNHYNGVKDAKKLIITGGTGMKYVLDAIEDIGIEDEVGVLSLGTLWPLPEKLITEHLAKAEKVLVVEEVDPFLEEHIAAIAGKNKVNIEICGRADILPKIGELNPEVVTKALREFAEVPEEPVCGGAGCPAAEGLTIPERELTFCAGCPHRASFFILKQALRREGNHGVVMGDIGCYTMAGQRAGQYGYHFMSCMGSGISAAEGLGQLTNYGFGQPVVSLCGDSTFFHTVVPGLINAKMNNANILHIVLDNSATAMTGFQPHPGTGETAMGHETEKISIQALCESLGCRVWIADPFDVEATTQLITELIRTDGLKVLILQQPCATLAAKTREKKKVWVDTDKCRGDACGCDRYCSRVWGCPGNVWDFEKDCAAIDEVVCVGCGVCAKICPAGAIQVEGGEA